MKAKRTKSGPRPLRVVSLFSGIGGFDLGFERAGFKVVAVVEQDKHCLKLLAERFPHAKQFTDVRKVGKKNLPACDVVVGGFPCQDLSSAGKRRGFRGHRSILFYELTRITHELQPPFLLWENVPGLLNSHHGHDFLAVLTELDRIGYFGAWRTFDAQHFGVAQRRRRVFGVFARKHFGAIGGAEVLSLAEGMRGHPAPSREARQGPAAESGGGAAGGGLPLRRALPAGHEREITGTMTARSAFVGGVGSDFEMGGGVITGTLTSSGASKAGSTDGKDGRESFFVSAPVTSKWSKGTGGPAGDECQNLIPAVAHTLTGEDSDTSEDGTGRGTPIVAFNATDYKSGEFSEDALANPITTSADRTRAAPILAFSSKDSCHDLGDKVSPTMRSGKGSGGVPPAVAINLRGREEGARPELADKASLRSASGGSSRSMVGVDTEGKVSRIGLNVAMEVRRLSPLECERLQGFPDNWTAGFSDAVRYRMLGNAVAVVCAEWIALRIAAFFKSRRRG